MLHLPAVMALQSASVMHVGGTAHVGIIGSVSLSQTALTIVLQSASAAHIFVPMMASVFSGYCDGSDGNVRPGNTMCWVAVSTWHMSLVSGSVVVKSAMPLIL